MLDRLAADLVLLLHAGFIAFAVLGALLVWRWPRLLWLHLPALGWAVFVMASGRICPLTPLENQLRQRAGEAGYSGGFIEHYLLAAIYPEGLTRGTQIALGLVLLLLNAALYAGLWWRRRPRRERSGA